MALIVQKYGGSSLATPRHIHRAAERIKELKLQGYEVLVVVSAMGHTTDHLIRLATRTVQRPPQRELDMLLTAGERVSMALLAMAVQELGIAAISFTGSQSGILTSNDHTEARIVNIRADRIQEEIQLGKVVIVAGFQGISLSKEITTLGRGGSDTTAVALAAALNAYRCDILTDVDGLFTADPRIVKQAYLIDECHYDEALELASLGAKMHYRSLELAKRFRVNVRICSSSNYACKGTILKEAKMVEREESMESIAIRGIATKEGYSYFESGVPLTEVLKQFKERKVPLRFFTYHQGRFCFLAEKERVPLIREILDKLEWDDYHEERDVAIISAVGEGILSTPDFVPEFLEIIRETGAHSLLFATNSLSATVAVSSRFKEAIAQKLHARWIGDAPKPDSAH